MQNFDGTTASAKMHYVAARNKIVPKGLWHTFDGRTSVLTMGAFDVLHMGTLPSWPIAPKRCGV